MRWGPRGQRPDDLNPPDLSGRHRADPGIVWHTEPAHERSLLVPVVAVVETAMELEEVAGLPVSRNIDLLREIGDARARLPWIRLRIAVQH